jgi:peptidyl-prolyl cis-trans isomerase D
MSIIQNIRERGAWIIFTIIVIALVAFILQDGVGRQNRGSNTNTIGTVNGQHIQKADFEEKVEIQVQNYAAQGIKREQIIGFLWNQEVDLLLFKSEQEKLGITVGNKELSDVLFGNESPFRQEFTDRATGEFKANDARQAIAQIKKSKNADQIKQIEKFYIAPSIENRQRSKYQALVIKGIQFPKWLANKEYAESNAISNISYVSVPYNSILDSTIKVSNDEIAGYLKDNAPAYQVDETSRNISFVVFSAAPSSSDSLSAYNQVMSLKEGFKASTDVAAYLNKVGSENVFYNSFLSKNRIQVPQKDSILSLPIGGVFGPYIDGKNLTIAKVVGTTQWPDSTSVRHILIATTNPQNGQQIKDDSVAKKLADSISIAIRGGASFEALCQQYSDDQGSKPTGGKIEMFPQAQMTPAFNDFSFANPVGTKQVVKTEFGYHYVEILKQTPRVPSYKIAYLSKPLLPSTETINAASTAAAQFATSSSDLKSFNANAVKSNKQALPATNIKENDFSIQGIGDTRAMVRWVYEKSVGDVSEPFEIEDNYLVAIITSEDKKGLMGVEAARPQVEGIVRDQKKATIIKSSFKGNSLESYAGSGKTTVQQLDSIGYAFSMLANVGNEPKIIGAAFNKSLLNKVSEPIAGNTGVFVVSVNALGAKPAQQDPTLYQDETLQRLRNIMFRTNVALRKAANIKDNRSKVY